MAAGVRLADIETKSKPVAACAPGKNGEFPRAAAQRVKLLDDWLKANDALRKEAFDKDPQHLRARLAALRDQVDAIRNVVD